MQTFRLIFRVVHKEARRVQKVPDCFRKPREQETDCNLSVGDSAQCYVTLNYGRPTNLHYKHVRSHPPFSNKVLLACSVCHDTRDRYTGYCVSHKKFCEELIVYFL
jgi:hypothetical protein